MTATTVPGLQWQRAGKISSMSLRYKATDRTGRLWVIWKAMKTDRRRYGWLSHVTHFIDHPDGGQVGFTSLRDAQTWVAEAADDVEL